MSESRESPSPPLAARVSRLRIPLAASASARDAVAPRFGEVLLAAGLDGAASDSPTAVARLLLPARVACGSCRFCLLGAETSCARLEERQVRLDPDAALAHYGPELLEAAWRVPAEVDDDDAARLGPMAEIFAGLRLAGFAAAESFAERDEGLAVVDGGGAFALQALAILRDLAPRWRTVVVETDEEARRIARGLGATRTVEPGRQLAKAVRELSIGLGAELVLATGGSAREIVGALAFARPGGAAIVFAPRPLESRVEIDARVFVRSSVRLLPVAGAARRDRERAAAHLTSRPAWLADLPTRHLPWRDRGRLAEVAAERPAALALVAG